MPASGFNVFAFGQNQAKDQANAANFSEPQKSSVSAQEKGNIRFMSYEDQDGNKVPYNRYYFNQQKPVPKQGNQ